MTKGKGKRSSMRRQQKESETNRSCTYLVDEKN